MHYHYDYIIIGSGFGGSVSALRLAEKGYQVAVMEMGRRFTPANMPASTWSFSRWLWHPALGLKGFFGMRFFKHVVILHGNAVGGGSITYANTLLEPSQRIWQQGSWAGLLDWQQEMPRHFATAKKMLGVTTNKILGPADLRLQQMAQAAGVGESFYPTEVGIFFGKDDQDQGKTYPDPYFDGKGPERTTCIGCGACMIGCQHGAKNTLDQNYLYLAEKLGTKIFAETKVIDVKPLAAALDGSAGYQITTKSIHGLQHFNCKGVVFAASSLGTQELMLRLKQRGSLPLISECLGKQVRTNAESLIGVRYPGSPVDLSQGVAIGSGVYLDEYTHIEATRYPAGSDTLGLLSTVMTLGRPGLTRPLTWIKTFIWLMLKNPLQTLRSLSPVGWARETIIFLCMQTLEGHLNMALKRRWYWPFTKRLSTEGKRIPTFIPAANDFAIKAARATGGIPLTSITEILFNVPMTAHCIGGAIMAASAAEGVCDRYNRVFNYQNMFICDGSVLAANLGVNPSLTITALTEHAMSHIPAKQEVT